MSDSSFTSARFGFFISFLALLATGFYAYTLRAQVARAETAASTASDEARAIGLKLAESQKAAQTGSEAAKACEAREAELKTKLETAAKAPATRRR